MEQIALRAIVVLSVIAALVGGGMYFVGAQSFKRASNALDYEYSRSESKEFIDCKADALAKNDSNSVDACYAIYGPDSHSIDFHTETVAKATKQMNFGTILAVGAPVLLFLTFYLLRWIIAGRWRGPKKTT